MRIFLSLAILIFSSSLFSRVPEKAHTFDFNIKMIKMERIKEEKVLDAVDILRRIFSSREFKKRILSHRYGRRKGFVQNRGLNNHQIYHKILDGMERLSSRKNNAMDVELELYTDHESTVLGYTIPASRRIWMNTKYFNKYPPEMIASNLIHEWLHKLGFDHDHDPTDRRQYSVPYAIGYIVRDMAKRPWTYE